jgi:hypothetical protein
MVKKPLKPLPRYHTRTVSKKLWRKALLEKEQEVHYPKLISATRREISTRQWLEESLRRLKRC